MMRKLIGLVLIVAALLGVKELHKYWEEVKAKQRQDQAAPAGTAAPAPATPPGVLPGVPAGLEASLQEARKQGPAALRVWLEKYRPYVQDPRLADLELDYVLLVGGRNIAEARRLFAAVKARTPTNSPVYPRVVQLERNFQ
jgi:hypothetical protein